MKIGQIAYTYKPIIGGAETYIATLSDLIVRAGNVNRIYQVARSGLKDKDISQVPVINIFKRKPLYFYNLFLNFYFFQLYQEDLLIVHDPFHFLPVSWHKSIVLSHGVRWDRPQKTEKIYCLIHYWSAKFAMKFANKLVANDTNFFRQLGHPISPKEKMFQEVMKNRWFIPNCVDTHKYKKSEPIAELQSLNPILVPRNIVRGRGIHLAISAFSKFRKIAPETNLVVCGDFIDSKYSREIFEQIKKLNLLGKVYFLGSVSWREMPKIYSSAVMTIIPTLYEEGTSLAALESMSCGIATVSTNVGGLVDLPTIVSKPSIDDLYKKMIFCYKNRKKISIKQQSEVRKTFNLTNFKNAWLRVINN